MNNQYQKFPEVRVKSTKVNQGVSKKSGQPYTSTTLYLTPEQARELVLALTPLANSNQKTAIKLVTTKQQNRQSGQFFDSSFMEIYPSGAKKQPVPGQQFHGGYPQQQGYHQPQPTQFVPVNPQQTIQQMEQKLNKEIG